jgi:hypothetical protein
MDNSHVPVVASAHSRDGLGDRRLGSPLVFQTEESSFNPYAVDEQMYWIPCARFGLARRTVIGSLCKLRMKLKRRCPDPPDMVIAFRRGER